MILDRSSWRPASEARVIPVAADRANGRGSDTAAGSDRTRRRQLAVVPRPERVRASPKSRVCPTRWNVKTGEHVAVAHADSWPRALEPHRLGRSHLRHQRDQQPTERDLSSWLCTATAMPSDDRSRQRWVIYAIDKRTGKMLWERVAHEGEPRNKRHIKSTYASASSRHRRPHRRRVVRIGGRVRLRPRRHAEVEGRSRARRHGRVRHSDLRVGTGELADHLEWPRHPAVSTRRRIRSCSRLNGGHAARPCGRPSATSCRRGARPRWR